MSGAVASARTMSERLERERKAQPVSIATTSASTTGGTTETIQAQASAAPSANVTSVANDAKAPAARAGASNRRTMASNGRTSALAVCRPEA